MGQQNFLFDNQPGEKLVVQRNGQHILMQQTYLLNKNKVTYGGDAVFTQSISDWRVYERREVECK